MTPAEISAHFNRLSKPLATCVTNACNEASYSLAASLRDMALDPACRPAPAAIEASLFTAPGVDGLESVWALGGVGAIFHLANIRATELLSEYGGPRITHPLEPEADMELGA